MNLIDHNEFHSFINKIHVCTQYFCYVYLIKFSSLVTIYIIICKIIFIDHDKRNKPGFIEIIQDFKIERSQMAQGLNTFFMEDSLFKFIITI